MRAASRGPRRESGRNFKDAESLRAIYEKEKGLKKGDDIIAYCRIGERSSHTWFVLTYLLGYDRVRNYDGSWTEWGNAVRVPIEKGAETMTTPVSPPAKTTTKPSLIHVEWVGKHQFEAGRPNGPTAHIDGDGETAQSPPETLLSALATCVSYDVVDIMAKQRTPRRSAHDRRRR